MINTDCRCPGCGECEAQKNKTKHRDEIKSLRKKLAEVQQELRAYRVLRMAVDAMMAPLGYHGNIHANDGRVDSVMKALEQIDAIDAAITRNEYRPVSAE